MNFNEHVHNFFGPPPKEGFKYYDVAHIISLVSIASFILLAYFIRGFIANHQSIFTPLFAILIILAQLSYNLNNYYNGLLSLKHDLPFSICGTCMLLCALMLMTKNKELFEILYFWCIPGPLFAITFPTLGKYNHQHFRFYQYMFGHGLLIYLPLYMMWTYDFTITFDSMTKSFFLLIAYVYFMTGFNYRFDTNYMFIRGPIDSKSILDFVPPCPINIILLSGISLFLFLLIYLPFHFL